MVSGAVAPAVADADGDSVSVLLSASVSVEYHQLRLEGGRSLIQVPLEDVAVLVD